MNLRLKKRRLKEIKKLRKVENFSSRKNIRLWSSRFLPVITIISMIIVTAVPASAQFTAPNANGSTGIACLGFFCNIAQKVTQNALFTPVGSGINGLVTIINVGFAFHYLSEGYGIARKMRRNQEEWKHEAVDMGKSLGLIVLVFVISLAFVTSN